MLDCISVENMRRSDALTIHNHVPSLELMSRAAQGVFRAVRWQGPVAIVAGSGNNGGDGFALACILHAHQIPCTVFTVSDHFSGDSAYYAQKARDSGVNIFSFTESCLQGFHTTVDCLLGTGFQGGLREAYKDAILAINTSGTYVVSVDINSGMNGDTGLGDPAVVSDLTVTIGYIKKGLITPQAGSRMKRLVCADIGIVLESKEDCLLSSAEWDALSHQPNFHLCPPWVEPTPIRAYEE